MVLMPLAPAGAYFPVVTSAAARTAEALFPLIAVSSFLVATLLVFAARCLALGRPRTPYIEARDATAAWKWLMEWWIWVWGPVERACIGLKISPNTITVVSTLATAGAAWLLADGALALGGWVYLFAASLDLVDGRVARAQGTATRAGAFLDSTLDRVSELLVFAGLAIHFRSSPALYAALASAGASLIVSYTRARGEALGATGEARVGGMQRAERVVLTGLPCAVSPAADALFGSGAGELLVGSVLAILALLTTATAAHRTLSVWRALRGPVPDVRTAGNVRWLDVARRRQRLGR
jgi:CDP-diacylglycerol---glycerol-3-phosphate 3-phosphatidyltransferase